MAGIGFGDIKAQAEALKSISLSPFTELARHMRGVVHVSDGLGAHERMLCLTVGTISAERGLFVLTDQRLIFVKSAYFSETEQMSLPLDQIEQVSLRETGREPEVIVQGTLDLRIEDADRARDFATLLRDAAAEAKAARYDPPRAEPEGAPLAPAEGATILGDDLISQLERLGTLRDKGVISETEFKDLKGRLLGL